MNQSAALRPRSGAAIGGALTYDLNSDEMKLRTIHLAPGNWSCRRV